MKPITRRNFVAGTGLVAVTPWWFGYVRNFFGPSGTIHDMGGIREATMEETKWAHDGFLRLKALKEPDGDIECGVADFEKAEYAINARWARAPSPRVVLQGGASRPRIFSNRTEGLTPAQAVVVAVNRVRGTNAQA